MENKYYTYLTSGLKPISDEDFFKLLDENKKILNNCNNHEFKLFIKNGCVCKHCGGVVDLNEKIWYEKGKEHQRYELKKINNYKKINKKYLAILSIIIILLVLILDITKTFINIQYSKYTFHVINIIGCFIIMLISFLFIKED